MEPEYEEGEMTDTLDSLVAECQELLLQGHINSWSILQYRAVTGERGGLPGLAASKPLVSIHADLVRNGVHEHVHIETAGDTPAEAVADALQQYRKRAG